MGSHAQRVKITANKIRPSEPKRTLTPLDDAMDFHVVHLIVSDGVWAQLLNHLTGCLHSLAELRWNPVWIRA